MSILKIKKEKKLSNIWGLILILILRNSGLRHVVDYSENSDTGIAELRTSSSGLLYSEDNGSGIAELRTNCSALRKK